MPFNYEYDSQPMVRSVISIVACVLIGAILFIAGVSKIDEVRDNSRTDRFPRQIHTRLHFDTGTAPVYRAGFFPLDIRDHRNHTGRSPDYRHMAPAGSYIVYTACLRVSWQTILTPLLMEWLNSPNANVSGYWAG